MKVIINKLILRHLHNFNALNIVIKYYYSQITIRTKITIRILLRKYDSLNRSINILKII